MTASDKRATRAAFWQPHIQQWKRSKQTQVAFCREHKLNFHQFNYWLRKEEPVKARKKPVSPSSPFIPVVKQQPTVRSGLSLSLPNGMVLQGINTDNLPMLKKLLEVLS